MRFRGPVRAGAGVVICAIAWLPAATAVAAPQNRDVSILGKILNIDRAGYVHVGLRCEADATRSRCRGTLEIYGTEPPIRGDLLGRRQYTVVRGSSGVAYLKLSQAARTEAAGGELVEVSVQTSGPQQNRDRMLFVAAPSERTIQPSPAPPGPTGPAGPPGNAGPPGERGATGATGPAGPQGDAGPAGPQGETGATGPQGLQGETGAQGATGATGAQGEIGPAGPQGETGAAGATGPAGPQGETGPAGPQGLQGGAGPAGAEGAPGAQGPQGERGLPGEPGQPGQTGQTGATGPQGPPGPAGQQGPQGDTGQQGQPGPAGQPGPEGQPGPTGPAGPTGPPGPLPTPLRIPGPVEDSIPAAPAGTIVSAVVSCPLGSLLLGGGGAVITDNATSRERVSMQVSEPDDANTWLVVGVVEEGLPLGHSMLVQATAICTS